MKIEDVKSVAVHRKYKVVRNFFRSKNIRLQFNVNKKYVWLRFNLSSRTKAGSHFNTYLPI